MMLNEYPTVHTTSNPLSPIYTQPGVEVAGTLPILGDKLLLTVYGQNGSLPTGGLVTNELIWELIDNGDDRFRIQVDGDECKLYLKANPNATVPGVPVDVIIRLRDAGGGTGSLSVDLPLQYDIVDNGTAAVIINPAPICTPEGDWNGSTGIVRYAVEFRELQPGVNYTGISLNYVSGAGSSLITAITPSACRIPTSIFNPGPTNLTVVYYFEVNWLLSNPEGNIQLSIDITGDNGIPVVGSTATLPAINLLTPIPGSIETCDPVGCTAL